MTLFIMLTFVPTQASPNHAHIQSHSRHVIVQPSSLVNGCWKDPGIFSRLPVTGSQQFTFFVFRYFNICIVTTREGLALLAHLYQPSLQTSNPPKIDISTDFCLPGGTEAHRMRSDFTNIFKRTVKENCML